MAPTDEQLKYHVEEKHYALVFLYKFDKYRYGKLIEDKENVILQKKDPFPKPYQTCAMCFQGGNSSKVSTIDFLNGMMVLPSPPQQVAQHRKERAKIRKDMLQVLPRMRIL